ncbi:palmitoyltransferase pfa5 [Aspergillus sp. HF37]|nr:palmitoyltransferase pfa5 [Aspergillus sp. HF37]
MTISTLQLAVLNLTTIENLSRRSAVWSLAIRVPDRLVNNLNSESGFAPTFPTISYPLQPAPPGPETQGNPTPPEERHVFAILQTQPGENPFDLGSWMRNLQQVLGFSLLDWILPIKQSPCADHSSLESAFTLGPVVDRLKREAGLEPPTQEPRHERKRRKHKRHR